MQEIYNKLVELSSDDLNLHLLTRDRKTKEYGILTSEIHENIRENLIENVKIQLNQYLERDYVEEEYCPVTRHDSHTVESISLDQIPIFQEISNSIQGDLDFYNSGNLDSDTQIWAFIMVIGDLENEIMMFQRCQPKKLLKPGKVLMIIERDNGHFSKFDETILTVDPKMDCISYNEKMYIFSKFYFEEIFGIIDKFEEDITEKLMDIPQEDSLVDLNELAMLCSADRNKEKKLYKILNDGGFDLLTEENVEQLNRSHNLGITVEDGKIQLTPTVTRNILNLMNQDCVDSTITDEPYITHSKSPVRR